MGVSCSEIVRGSGRAVAESGVSKHWRMAGSATCSSWLGAWLRFRARGGAAKLTWNDGTGVPEHFSLFWSFFWDLCQDEHLFGTRSAQDDGIADD